MKVGEVRVAEDADFRKLKDMCHETEDDGWDLKYGPSSSTKTTVWTKKNDISDFKLLKVRSIFKDIPPCILYDVLHDPDYRKTWDSNMMEGFEIGCINPNNDIGYYALKTPKPLKNRDFVILRSWLQLHREYFIINHSVNHKDLPMKHGFVRGISYITGYHIQPSTEQGGLSDQGCLITYVTQSDPKGRLPSWAINKLSSFYAPKLMKNMHKACRNYESWKEKHKPSFKPWLYPEQSELPRIDINVDILSIQSLVQMAECVDESQIEEQDVADL